MIIERPRRRATSSTRPTVATSRPCAPSRALTRADLDRALTELARTEGIRIRTIAGINEDGVFGSRQEGGRPDLPDACAEPFVPVLWLQVLELLGRVPEGSTAKFLEDGTVPD
jgi:hypothetical protein